MFGTLTWKELYMYELKRSNMCCTLCNSHELCVICYTALRPTLRLYILGYSNYGSEIIPSDVMDVCTLCWRCREAVDQNIDFLYQSKPKVVDPSMVAVMQGFEL